MQNLLKLLKSLEDSGILLDGLTEKVKNEVQEQKGGFLSKLLGTLTSSLLMMMICWLAPRVFETLAPRVWPRLL